MAFLWLLQMKSHHNYYMTLYMRGEEKKRFVAGCRKRYGEKRSRKAKSDKTVWRETQQKSQERHY